MAKKKRNNLLHKKLRRLLPNKALEMLQEINENKNEAVYFRFYDDLKSIIEPVVELTDIRGAAKHFGVHPNTIRNWIKKGKLKRDFYESHRVEIGSVPKFHMVNFARDAINEALKVFRPMIGTDGRRVFFTVADNQGHQIGKYDQVKANEEQQISGPVLLWVRYAQLLTEISPDWDRLKECDICKNIFWDSSPNKVRKICESIECVRERAAKAVKTSRVKKILNEIKRGK